MDLLFGLSVDISMKINNTKSTPHDDDKKKNENIFGIYFGRVK
jgi:hypothetical protein